jgi:3-methyladenine DNA glycosylase AlkD
MKQAPSSILQTIEKVLEESIDSTPERICIFFKTGPGAYAAHDQFMGIRVPTLRKIAKAFISISLEDLTFLIQSPINEKRLLALIILTQQYSIASHPHKDAIFDFYRSHIAYINNWNLVDSSAHLIVGAHLFKGDCSILETWAQSKNMWERRIAVVATLYFIRKAKLEWTFKIAKLLLNDPHDLIHKALGWMLREAGKKDPAQLIQFLDQHRSKMPRTMLRYAIERLPEAQRKMYLGSR